MDYIKLIEGAEGEIVEKKSRFIAQIAPVETEEEAYAFIEKIKKNIMMQDITASHFLWAQRCRCFGFRMMESHRALQESQCWS